jgi:hypothetical protein
VTAKQNKTYLVLYVIIMLLLGGASSPVSDEQKEHSKPVLGNKCHTMLAVSSEQKECRKPAL